MSGGIRVSFNLDKMKIFLLITSLVVGYCASLKPLLPSWCRGLASVAISSSLLINGPLYPMDSAFAASNSMSSSVIVSDILSFFPTQNDKEVEDVPSAPVTGLSEQLQQLRQQQIEKQRTSSQQKEEELMSKELMYPEGRLIARGIVSLTPSQNPNNFDKANFPYGLLRASEINEVFNNDDSTLFLLAVGREGPPLAAKKVKANNIEFPYVFEITSDDLLFPYTPDAWLKSSNSKDTVAVTAILSLDGILSTPSDFEYVGFALSDPVVIAGAQGRVTAKVNLSGKIDKALFTETETANLKSVDDGINSIELAKATPPTTMTKKTMARK